MCDFWARRGDSVTLITLASRDQDFYRLDSRVERVELDLLFSTRTTLGAIRATLRRIIAVRRAILRVRPDVVVSFVDQMNVITALATAGTSIPTIVSERIDPLSYVMPRPWPTLRELAYRLVSGIVVQSSATVPWARRYVNADRVAVIPNPLNPEFENTLNTPIAERDCVVVAAGRLVPQKGFDLLIPAFTAATVEHPGWRLVIYGAGSECATLQRQASLLQSSERIHLPGETASLREALRQAGVFVLSSRFEGFPNVLLEAMACGCPVISTDCPTGPSDMITPDHDGLLVPVESPRSLRAAIERLLGDPGLRIVLSRNAYERARAFSLPRVMELWDALFTQIKPSLAASSRE
jgi:glycosyltransferase involved in cell wall biosynthesis